MKNRNTLIEELLAYEGSANIEQTDSLITSVEAYLSSVDEADNEMYYMLQVLLIYKADYEFHNHVKNRNMAEHILEYLQNTGEWSFVEICIVAMTIGFTKAYTLSVDLAQEAIDVLDDEYASERYHYSIKSLIQYNMTRRLMRAMFFEINDPIKQEKELNEVKKLFYNYWNILIEKCKKQNLTGIMKVLNVRKSIVDCNCNMVFAGLAAFNKKDRYEKQLLKTMTDEVVEFLYHQGDTLTTTQRNWLTGVQIKRRRLQLGMTTDDLADAIDNERSYVNKIERGVTGVSPKRLYEIAKVLDTEITYFYGNVSGKPTADTAVHRLGLILQNASEQEKQYIVDMADKFMKFQHSDNK